MVKTASSVGGNVKTFTTRQSNIQGCSYTVTDTLRSYGWGLRSNTERVMFLPSSCGVEKLDRLTFNNNDWQVDFVDNDTLDGVSICEIINDKR